MYSRGRKRFLDYLLHRCYAKQRLAGAYFADRRADRAHKGLRRPAASYHQSRPMITHLRKVLGHRVVDLGYGWNTQRLLPHVAHDPDDRASIRPDWSLHRGLAIIPLHLLFLRQHTPYARTRRP